MSRGSGALVAIVALACSGEPAPDAGVDASSDGGRDGGHDAGRDAGLQDAGRDAAGDDAGPPSAWRLLPGLPDGCVVEYTTEPTELEPFERGPCGDRAGCERIAPSWEWGRVEMRVDGGVMNADPPAFFFSRDGPLGHWEKWLVTEDGTARVGVRGDLDHCYPAPFGASTVAFGFSIREPEADFNHAWVFGGPLSFATVANYGRLSDLVSGSSVFDDVRVGSARLAVESAPLHTIVDVPFEGDARMIADGTDGGQTYVAAVVNETVFYNVYGARHHIRAATAGERGRVLVDPPDAEAIRVMADGTDLAWIQAYGRIEHYEFERLELWASPYAERAEDLVPRRVATLASTASNPPVTLGAGHVAIVEYDAGTRQEVVRVVRLADGARADITSAFVGFRIGAAYITPERIAIPVTLGGSPPTDVAIWLIDLDSLSFVVP